MSRIIERINTVMTAHLNDAVDHLESPATMSRQLMRDWADEVDQARQALIHAAATCKTLEKRINQMKPKARRWRLEAETYLRDQKEQQAREALRRALLLEESVEQLDTTLSKALETKQQLSDRLAQIRNDQLRSQAQATVIQARSRLLSPKAQTSITCRPSNTADRRREKMLALGEKLDASEALLEAEIEISSTAVDSFDSEETFNEHRLDAEFNQLREQFSTRKQS